MRQISPGTPFELRVRRLPEEAEQEREAISRRTREALAAARARGVKIGNPTALRHSGGLDAADSRSAMSSLGMPTGTPRTCGR